MGGADFIAGIMCKTIAKAEEILILRTEDPEWSRPEWFPAGIRTVDLSGYFRALPVDVRTRVLYELIREIGPEAVINVNSRVAFDMLELYGARVARLTRLACYYFCADRDLDGREVGYPVEFFSNILAHLTAAIVDNATLAQQLEARHALPPVYADRLKVAYTPAQVAYDGLPFAELQMERAAKRKRPKLLWGGRFDRQKRFDLLVAIARAMEDVDFHCWGKPVLDQSVDMTDLPDNLTVHPPYRSLFELPLSDCDGWLYTSAWDGLPTVLIECAQLGLPVVASLVGGVGELITQESGWPVAEVEDVDAYVEAIRAMLADPQEKLRRARNLQAAARERHTAAMYAQTMRRFFPRRLMANARNSSKREDRPADLSVVITAHNEGCLIGPTLRSARLAIDNAVSAHGIRIETIVVLDRADAATRTMLTGRQPARIASWRPRWAILDRRATRALRPRGAAASPFWMPTISGRRTGSWKDGKPSPKDPMRFGIPPSIWCSAASGISGGISTPRAFCLIPCT